MNIYHIPENEQVMDEIYVVLSQDEKGEGICSMMTTNGGMPMVFGHERMLDMIKPLVEKMAKESAVKLKIARFKKSEVLQEFGV